MALYVVGFQPHYFDAPWIEGFGELALLFRRISVQLCVKPLPVSFFFCIIPCQVSTVRLPSKDHPRWDEPGSRDRSFCALFSVIGWYCHDWSHSILQWKECTLE